VASVGATPNPQNCEPAGAIPELPTFNQDLLRKKECNVATTSIEAAAPVVDLPTSRVKVFSDTTSGGARQLRARISAPEDVLNSLVVVQASRPIVTLTANGSVLDIQKQTPQTVQINVIGWQIGGITLDITVASAGPVSVIVQDRRLGIPKIPGVTIAPRPDWMMPAPLNDVADSTIVRRTFRF
jgi:hypothetical protein